MKAEERHRLKHDKYAETVVSGFGWARHHQSTIIAIFVALLVITGVSVWMVTSRRQAQERGRDQLREAMTEADKAMGAKPEERKDAVAAAVRHFAAIAADYPGTDTAAQALLAAGDLQLHNNQPADALKTLEQAAGAAKNLPGLSGLAHRGMGQALEQLGKPGEAIKQYQQFTQTPSSPEAVQAFWDIGRCYEQLNDKEKAEESYRKASEFGGKSEWANLAAFRLKELAAGKALLGATTTTTSAPATTTSTTVASTTTSTVAVPPTLAPEKPAGEATTTPPAGAAQP